MAETPTTTMTLPEVLQSIRDVMLGATLGEGEELDKSRGHVGDVTYADLPKGWRLMVYIVFADPEPSDNEIEWETVVRTVLLRVDDPSDTETGETELERAWSAYLTMYMAMYALAFGERDDTPFEGKTIKILLPEDGQDRGIRLDGFDDADGKCMIGSTWRVNFRSQA